MRPVWRPLARHLQRFDEIGPQVTGADLDDMTPLLGRRPRTWDEGEHALKAFVLADEDRHDRELLALFHRRTRRDHMLLGPLGSAMTTHHRVQPFRPSAW